MSSYIQAEFEFEKAALLLTVDEIYETVNQSLLKKLEEDKRIERKPPNYHARALGDYISMYANSVPDGGIIVLGIEDDGRLTGCTQLSQNQRNDLERAGRIYCPDARYDTKLVPIINTNSQEDFVILIRVYYRPDKLVRTASGDAFYRRGGSKEKYKPEEAHEEEIDRGQIDLEQEPCHYTYPQDFDLDLIHLFAGNFRKLRELREELTDEDILRLRHLGKIEKGEFRPNVACALLFARDATAQFPGCKIRFLRFDGEHEGTGDHWNAIKDIWIDEGPVPKLIVEAEKVLDSQIREFTRLGSDNKFYTAPEYPKTAWYEALVNACVHRSYGLRNMNIFIKMFDDRLVIESPGGFPPTVTPENIYDIHHPRNPHLMDAMFYLRFVRCAREGTRRIRDSMAEMKLPKPEFAQKEIAYSSVRVTLRNDIKHRKVYIDKAAISVISEVVLNTLDQDERRVINFVAENKKINVSQVQRLTSRSWPSARNLLLGLKRKGILKHLRRRGLDRDPQAYYTLQVSPSVKDEDKEEHETK